MTEENAATESTGALILIIEDDNQIRRFLRATLNTHGYKVAEATVAQDGIRQTTTQHPDLILLDLGLPDIDGLEVTRQLREWTTTPIIVVSVKDHESDKVAALNAGADDYVTKPFGTDELLARIRVALRHSVSAAQGKYEPVYIVADLKVDLAHRQVYVGEEKIHLSPIEYKLLTTLVRNAGKVVTGKQLLREVWGPAYTNEVPYLRLYMSKLRHKLEKDPTEPRYLITEPGVGYRLLEE
jgi:two-component system, OmpR family, KDP operon response regulator KdpE